MALVAGAAFGCAALSAGAQDGDGTPPALVDAQERERIEADLRPPKGSSGLEIVSDDGSAKLKFGGQLQFRHVYNHRNGSGVDQDDAGFEFRRLRLNGKGSIENGKVPFYVQAEADRTNTLEMIDAWIGYKVDDENRFRAGQFAPGFTREELVSSKRRLASDNSIAHSNFTLNRSQGVDWVRQTEDWTTFLFFGEGDNDRGTPYTMDADYGVTARVQRKFGEGDWKRHEDFIGKPGEELAYLIGGGVSIAGGEMDADSDGMADDDFYDFRYTADAGVEGDGWNAFAAFFGQQFDAQTMEEVNAYGATVQGGVFVTDDVDIFAQYAWADDDADNGELNVITAGFNKYIEGHTIKFTMDANYAFDPITSTFNSSSRGYLVDAMGEDGQFVLRSQLQVLF